MLTHHFQADSAIKLLESQVITLKTHKILILSRNMTLGTLSEIPLNQREQRE